MHRGAYVVFQSFKSQSGFVIHGSSPLVVVTVFAAAVVMGLRYTGGTCACCVAFTPPPTHGFWDSERSGGVEVWAAFCMIPSPLADNVRYFQPRL